MTGLAPDQVDQLVLLVRHNVSQALPAELFGCSQPTVSRLVDRFLPVITAVLAPLAEQVAAKELRSTVRVDGFLAPTGDRRANTFTSGMFSGKHHRCGFNIQVVGSAHGTPALTDRPLPGATHDAKAWHESGLAQRFVGRLYADGGPGGFVDTAYTGTGLCVPDRKPKGQSLTASDREFNRVIASQRPALSASSRI
ncbi:transposase family protein [Hamadaea tsunoensis]|uniref:transposase family protein n=1 Tax=Hamadaea tsunoensis TaxID=53368 RepID=UPI00041589BC|nr:transposase family protein [Hamadaea tsunoensis]